MIEEFLSEGSAHHVSQLGQSEFASKSTGKEVNSFVFDLHRAQIEYHLVIQRRYYLSCQFSKIFETSTGTAATDLAGLHK